MPVSLLATKFHVPPLRSELVSRKRLLDRISVGVKGKLTLISSPAGFGKTTLLGEWIVTFGNPVAWLSLEREDNDPGRFWTYFLEAIRTLQPNLGKNTFELQFASSQSQADTFLTSLINEIDTIPDQLLLILDDYHVIDSSSIQEGMIFLLDHMPAQLHLVVASRADPAWPLAYWRSRGQLVEIRATDLRFRSEEAADFLSRTMKLDLPPQDIAALEERTEGWVAGLQMAALSLYGREDVQEFIHAFTGSNRFIFDYLMEEVLGRQPMQVQEFLLKTSVLERLIASLCDAILERTDSRDTLDKLEKANLFLIPLDDERQWYRYHHLFRDLLRQHLKQTVQVEEMKKLHRQASSWLGMNKLISEAVQHALAADDMIQVISLIESNIFSMLDRGEITTLVRCLDEIPSEIKAARPWLSITHAWLFTYAGKLDFAEESLQAAKNALNSLDESERSRAKGYIDTIWAYVYWMRGLGKEAVTFSQRALALLPEEELSVRAFAFNTLGSGHVQCDELEDAHKSYRKSIALGRASGNAHVYTLASVSLAYLFIQQGQSSKAEQICNEVLSYLESNPNMQTPAIAQIYAMQSLIFGGRCELEKALDAAWNGLEICKKWNQLDSLIICYTYLIEVLIALGNFEEAAMEIAKIKKLGMDVSTWYQAIIEEEEVLLNLAVGDITAAARWVDEKGLDYRDVVPEPKRTMYRTLAQVLLAQGKNAEAAALLSRLIKDAENSGANGFLLPILPLLSLAHFSLGYPDQALTILDRALVMAEPVKYKKIYAELGEPMAKLLQLAIEHKVHPDYAAILVELIEEKQARKRGTRLPGLESHLVARNKTPEPISEREMEILRLLDSTLNTPEIAAQLYISVGTVRTHIKNIYRKLDVNRRMEAVLRARELGLI